jgi:hypothetical protein
MAPSCRGPRKERFNARLEYTIERSGNIKVINLAKATDSTGTLYFAPGNLLKKKSLA